MAAAILSAYGVNNDVVAYIGCASGLAFSFIVLRDIYRAWRDA